MSEYRFSLTRFFPQFYLKPENTDHRKPIFWYILHNESLNEVRSLEEVNTLNTFVLGSELCKNSKSKLKPLELGFLLLALQVT